MTISERLKRLEDMDGFIEEKARELAGLRAQRRHEGHVSIDLLALIQILGWTMTETHLEKAIEKILDVSQGRVSKKEVMLLSEHLFRS